MPGSVSGFTCPECGGALWEIEEGKVTRFRCRVGHAYSPESLLSQQGNALEGALWAALRSLEETAALMSRLGERMKRQGNTMTAARFEARAREARDRAALVRAALLSEELVPEARTGLEPDQASRRAERVERDGGRETGT